MSHIISKAIDRHVITIEYKNTLIKYAEEQIAAKNNIYTYQQLIKSIMTNHGATAKYT